MRAAAGNRHPRQTEKTASSSRKTGICHPRKAQSTNKQFELGGRRQRERMSTAPVVAMDAPPRFLLFHPACHDSSASHRRAAAAKLTRRAGRGQLGKGSSLAGRVRLVARGFPETSLSGTIYCASAASPTIRYNGFGCKVFGIRIQPVPIQRVATSREVSGVWAF
jgi:hypothetical protein